jgi:hypothetical protein
VGIEEVSSVSCSTHSRPLELFCHTCKHTICFECTLNECKDHGFEKTQDVVVNAMKGVRQVSTQLTQHLLSSSKAGGLVNEALVKTDQVLVGESLELQSINRLVHQCLTQTSPSNLLSFFLYPLAAFAEAEATTVSSLQQSLTQFRLAVTQRETQMQASIVSNAFHSAVKGVVMHKEQLEMMEQCASSMVGMSDRLMSEVAKTGNGSALEQHKVRCTRMLSY